VTMIFEMTRDYDIVLPMILAVALSLWVRRFLSRENIYTAKLVGRGHPIPKALHANMFLVQSAREVMLSDVAVLDERTRFDEFLQASPQVGGLRHVVTARDDTITGVLRVNADLRRAVSATGTDVTLGELARATFTIAREREAAFDVIGAMWTRAATMAVVIREDAPPLAGNVLGVITKEQIADAVASSIRIYPR
jgi:CIC family chloride channel protein